MAAKKREPKQRPFPWPCPNCMTATVEPAVLDFTAKVKHDGVMHEVHLPAIEIPQCKKCGEKVITAAVDEQINDALRSQLRFLTPEQIRKVIRTTSAQG